MSMQQAIDCTGTECCDATIANYCEMSLTFVQFTWLSSLAAKKYFETTFLEQLSSTPEKKEKQNDKKILVQL